MAGHTKTQRRLITGDDICTRASRVIEAFAMQADQNKEPDRGLYQLAEELRALPQSIEDADPRNELISTLKAALLETLRALESHLDETCRDHSLNHRDLLCPCNQNEVVRAKAALAKAEGR